MRLHRGTRPSYFISPSLPTTAAKQNYKHPDVLSHRALELQGVPSVVHGQLGTMNCGFFCTGGEKEQLEKEH